MVRRFSIDFALLAIVLDAAVIEAGLVLASVLRPVLNVLPFAQNLFGVQTLPLALYPVLPVVWVICLLLFSVYDPSRNYDPGEELTSFSLGSLLAGVALAGVLYLSFRDVSRLLYLSFFAIAFSFTAIWRLGWFGVSRWLRRGSAQTQRVLIIGAGVVGRNFQGKILGQRNSPLTLVGFLDDDPQKRSADPSILDSLENVRGIVRQQRVDHVILALPRRAHERVNRLVADLHDLPVKVYVIPDYFALTIHHAAVEEFAGIPVLDLRAPALNDYQRLVKRAFDILVTLLLMPVLLPFMGFVALAVRLDSRGPALFHQERVGENGRTFRMHKFRTMVENAESMRHLVERTDEHGRLIHKHADDPRVTRLGGFLRRTSVDELPQFFNVLKGEMSLVGPRPEMTYLVEKYEPWQRKRFAVPPGLTGWWQTHGRSDKPMHLNTEEDLYYIQNYSPWLDVVILVRTIGTLLTRRGAF